MERYTSELYQNGNDAATVRRRYRQASLKYHPNRGGSTQEFQNLGAAYKHVLNVLNARRPPMFLEKKTYESEFRAVDKNAPPLSQEAYEFLDELITNAVLGPLTAKTNRFVSTWGTVFLGYYDKNVPAVAFGKSKKTSRDMFEVGKKAMARTLPAVNFSSVLANVKSAHAPHFSTLRIWKALRLLFESNAETNHAAAIVVRFIRLIYTHMKARGGPYADGVRTAPGILAKGKTYARVRFMPQWLTRTLPEDYEISKKDIVQGLKTSGYDDVANFAAVFDTYDEIYRGNARSRSEKFQNEVASTLKKGVKVSNDKLDKLAGVLKKGFRVSATA